VLIQKHHSKAWVTRAKEDLEPYLAAAMEGTLPNMVTCPCECKNTHNVMCSKTRSRRQADTEIINQVLMWLRQVADQVREERASAPVDAASTGAAAIGGVGVGASSMTDTSTAAAASNSAGSSTGDAINVASSTDEEPEPEPEHEVQQK